ncbi:MAG TPA: DUF4910 domain-containing protein, partial [Hyphomicrobium sp.]|nr:DUF4910 domain-containing protein [Hyphomicrobium sp.]
SQTLRDSLTEDAYRVIIRSEFTPGALKIGEVYIPGERPENFVLAAHLDHPAMVNDDLSGVVVGLEAARWSARAAEQGLPAAEYDYAVMLLQGRGLKADEAKAIKYLSSAAEKGVAGAQNRLSHVYAEGAGVDASPVQAAKWRLIAKTAGVEDERLDQFVAALTEDERTEAEKAAEDWQMRKQIMP